MAKHGKSFLQLLVDFIFFCLVILGVGGTMFKVLMPDGWLKIFMHEIWQFNTNFMLVIPVFALIAFILAKRWLGGFSAKATLGDLIMYVWMALGLYFAFKLLVTGSW